MAAVKTSICCIGKFRRKDRKQNSCQIKCCAGFRNAMRKVENQLAWVLDISFLKRGVGNTLENSMERWFPLVQSFICTKEGSENRYHCECEWEGFGTLERTDCTIRHCNVEGCCMLRDVLLSRPRFRTWGKSWFSSSVHGLDNMIKLPFHIFCLTLFQGYVLCEVKILNC